MHKLLKEQIKENFGKGFDFDMLTDTTQLLLEDIAVTYKRYDQATKLLQDELQLQSDVESDTLHFGMFTKRIPGRKSIHETNLLLQQYKNAVHSNFIVSRTDLDGKITYANTAFCNVSGYSKEELIGQSQNIVRHPDMKPEFFEELWDTIKAKQIWRGELKNRAKDGSTYYIDMAIFPLLDTENNVTEYLSIRHDMTAHITLQNKLDMEQKYSHMLFNSQDNVVFTTELSQGVTSANQKFFETFNFINLKDFKKKHHCLGELFIEKEGFLSLSAEDTKTSNWITTVLDNPDVEHKALIKNKYGEDAIFKVLASSIDYNNEHFVIVSLVDVTVLEEAREVAEASEKLKSTFMANMSHEIRTPMNGIFGFTKLLKNSSLTPEQQRFTRLIEHSTQTLLKIIDDILDFSKIESGKLELDLSEVNPFTQLRSSIAIFSPKAKEKNINYRVHIDSNISECLAMDHLRITQVLTNLINNALKFTASKGTIDIRVEIVNRGEDGKETLRFSVEDTGIGIAPDRIKSVFKSFIQADSSTTRNFGGTGLGLTISSSLCQLMGSELKVTSVEGEGSCFYFVIPFDKCKVNSTLSKQIVNPPVYLLSSSNPMFDKVVQQLNHFKLDVAILTMDELMYLDNSEHIVITFESWNCQPLIQKEHKVILIQEDIGVRVKEELDKSIYHIESFSAYPSELYNAILELNYTPTEDEVVIDEPHLQLNILIAEDYDINRILINEMLMRYNLIPDFCMNGEEAILMVQKKDYDLILMDINMPVLNGIDATIELRKLHIKTPIVALTANALEGDKEHFLNVGMNDYISKPIDPKTLHAILLKYADEKSTGMVSQAEEIYELDKALECLSSAKKIMRFNNETLIRLFESFMVNTTTIVTEITEAIRIEDKNMVRIKMHGLRGILRSLQINQIADLCEKLEYNYERLHSDEFWSLTNKVLLLLKSIHNQEKTIIEGINHLD